MPNSSKNIDLISPLHVYKMLSEVENEAHEAKESLSKIKEQKANEDFELKQLRIEKKERLASLDEVTVENQQYDKKIKDLNTKEEQLKKDITICSNEAYKLMNEHKRAQEKLKEVDFDPTFYQDKLAHLRTEIQKANEELEVHKKQYQKDYEKYGFSLKREQKPIKEISKPEPQLSALDELRRERESRQQVSLNLDDK